MQLQTIAGRCQRREFLLRSGAVACCAAAAMRAPRLVRAAETKAKEKPEKKWGDLVGRFVYDGKPPERQKLKIDKDLDFCGKFDIRDESLLVGKDGGLANVFVWLRSAKVDICPELLSAAAKQVKLDNRDCIFQPHCMTIWLDKQAFYIVNSDPVAQNVAFSPLGDTPANIILAVGGDATHKFARKQNAPVSIACNYHPWESAFILPRDNPYADISTADGAFRIARLPVGTWEFQSWHERIGNLDAPQWPKGRFTATIEAGSNDLGTIKLSPARLVKK